MSHNTTAILKMTTATTTGVAVSLADLEQAMRLISIGLTITFSIIVFVRNSRKNKRNEKGE